MGLGIFTLYGEISILVMSVRVCFRVVAVVNECVDWLWFWHGTLSSPDDGYFLYDPRPISGQQWDKRPFQVIYAFVFRLKIEPDNRNCQILSSVLSRIINTQFTRQQQVAALQLTQRSKEWMTKAASPCFTPRIPSASLCTIRQYTAAVGLRASDLHTIIHGVAEAGSVRAFQWLRREHTAYKPPPCWPWVLGWVKTSRKALETSFRGQTRG